MYSVLVVHDKIKNLNLKENPATGKRESCLLESVSQNRMAELAG